MLVLNMTGRARVRVRHVAALAVMCILAGCTESSPATSKPADGPTVVTDHAAPLANGSHVHDYWGSSTSKVIVDDDIRVAFQSVAGVFRQQIPIPEGTLVPQGTSQIDITVTLTAQGGDDLHGDMKLLAKTAADSEPQEIGVVQSGGTHVVPSSHERNDVPHQGLSAWEFYVDIAPMPTPARELPIYAMDFELSALIVATRGLELPVFPPHPDKWGESSSMVVLEQRYQQDMFGLVGGRAVVACLNVCPGVHGLDNGSVVLPETSSMDVEIVFEGPIPTKLALSYHGADTRGYTRLEPSIVEDRRVVYTIAVAPGTADGPYALQSAWEFALGQDDQHTNNVYHGNYTITGTIFK